MYTVTGRTLKKLQQKKKKKPKRNGRGIIYPEDSAAIGAVPGTAWGLRQPNCRQTGVYNIIYNIIQGALKYEYIFNIYGRRRRRAVVAVVN